MMDHRQRTKAKNHQGRPRRIICAAEFDDDFPETAEHNPLLTLTECTVSLASDNNTLVRFIQDDHLPKNNFQN